MEVLYRRKLNVCWRQYLYSYNTILYIVYDGSPDTVFFYRGTLFGGTINSGVLPLDNEDYKELIDDVPSEKEKAPETLFEAYSTYRRSDSKAESEKYPRTLYVPEWLLSQYYMVSNTARDDYGYKYASSVSSLFAIGVRFGGAKLFEEYDETFPEMYIQYANVNGKLSGDPFDVRVSSALAELRDTVQVKFPLYRTKSFRLYLRTQGIASRLAEVLGITSNAVLVFFALKALTMIGREDCSSSAEGAVKMMDYYFLPVIKKRKVFLDFHMNDGTDEMEENPGV